MLKRTHSLWVSHSSISEFLKCPRAYFLKYVYKDPKTGHKITLMNPSLALGQTVHQVLESLQTIKAEERLKGTPLIEKYNESWKSISGEKGGFRDEVQELEYKNRGSIMINRVMFHPGPITQKAVRLVSPDSLPPRYYLSKDDDILLCGKIDWLEYISQTDSVHIIDFKTGIQEEKDDSLQLPIYGLLVKNCQNRKISGVSYWYLEKDNKPRERPMPDLEKAHNTILEIALQMKRARAKEIFVCAKNGCYACKPFENILSGKAKFVGSVDYQDIYIELDIQDPNDYEKEDILPF